MRGSSIIAAASSLAAAVSAAPETDSRRPTATILKANPLASADLSQVQTRRLEDGSNIYNSNVEYGRCHRVKVHEDYDDDGGQNFYGGKYHAKTMAFASFFVCSDNEKGTCGSCDYGTEYVLPLDEYLQQTVQYINNYCAACNNQCRRRKLEDGEEDNNNNQNNNYDCDTCSNTCSNYNGAGDESNYLNCQAAYADNEGNQLYSAPTCDPDTGDIIIDMFYDEDCQIKHYVGNYYDFNYNIFEMVQESCVDCASSNGLCGDMYSDAYHCVNGNNQNGNVQEDEDVSACKSFRQAFMERTYHKKKKTSPVFAIIVFVLALSACFAFGSYTYYVRHRGDKAPLASLDHGDGTSMPQGQMA